MKMFPHSWLLIVTSLLCVYAVMGAPSLTSDSETQLTVTRCPDVCSCVSGDEGLSITCKDGDPVATIRNLPIDARSLTYYFTDDFYETNISFSHLKLLRTLILSSVDFDVYDGAQVIYRPDLLKGLNDLRRLGLHFPLSYINPSNFEAVPRLAELDLSHTRHISKGTLVIIFESLRKNAIPLKKLYLRNFRHPKLGSPSDIIATTDDILRHLDGVPITELDLTQNGAMNLQPGFIEFLPKLEVLKVGSDLMLDHMLAKCLVAELVGLHPSIRVLNVNVDSLYADGRFRRWTTGDVIEESKNATPSLICKEIPRYCLNSTKIPCEYIPRIADLWTNIGTDCVYGLSIPLAPHLEVGEFNAPSMFYGNKAGLRPNQTVCFNEDNVVKYFNMANNNAGESAAQDLPVIKGLNRLQYANIAMNKFEIIRTDTFKYFGNLTTLIAKGNTLRLHLDEKSDFFRYNTRLRILDLEQCEIESIPQAAFSELRELEVLNLRDNKLRNFSVDMEHMPSLRLLNLSRNLIQTLPTNLTTLLDRLADHHVIWVDLTGNPLVCGCHNLEFVDWLLNTKVLVTTNGSLLCRHPTMGLTSITNLVAVDLQDACDPSIVKLVVSLVLGMLSVVVAVVLAVTIYKKRWTFRYYIYIMKKLFLNRGEPYGRVTEYEYDAFVVYSAEDRHWVHDVLVKTLEGTHGLKLCIHFRDFIPGRDIDQNIVDSIDSSRKTIIVLSPNFLQSDWCYFEFRMARQRYVNDGVNVIILVMLQQLPMAGVSKSLGQLLQRQNYVSWTEDVDGQKLFWKRLTKGIGTEPHNDLVDI